MAAQTINAVTTLGGRKILLVDNTVPAQEAMHTLLQCHRVGVDVELCQDGQLSIVSLATDDCCYVFDMLAIGADNLVPLFAEFLLRDSIEKVLILLS